jgi:hypothetical protein
MTNHDDDRRSGGPWRPPTRRAFVAMLAAAAAGLALREKQAEVERPPSRWSGQTRWIGHC